MVRYTREFKARIVFALAFAVVFLALAILAGRVVSDARAQSIRNLEGEIRTALDDFTIATELRGDICASQTYVDLLTRKLDEEGTKISALEEKYGKSHPRIVNAKKLYNVLLLKHYLAVKELNEMCGANFTTILFFYSNQPLYKDVSEDQGIILGLIRKKFSDRVRVYALDVDLGLATVDFLREKYGVESVPAVVIDGKTYGYLTKEQVEEILSSGNKSEGL
ncbi:hypothetical protein D6817_02535 [Candidatus Pacearchaeota archaeon]|nr:MAG: hypothetical protein D6817_02535 [Candidatus Pacearchaeota archaeon]